MLTQGKGVRKVSFFANRSESLVLRGFAVDAMG
jgi:hypothetical protein